MTSVADFNSQNSPTVGERTLLLRQILPVVLTNGNDGRGGKWFKTAKRRLDIESLLMNLGMIRKPFEVPVDLVIRRLLGKRERLWDADSVGRGSAKELIDALVSVGWFHDDGPKWIRHCQYTQDSSMRELGPAVMVEVWAEVTNDE